MARRGAGGGIARPDELVDRACRGLARALAAAVIAAVAAGCSSTSERDAASGPADTEQDRAEAPQGANYKVGKPYEVAGRRFHPQEDPGYDSVGKASWYGPEFHGQRTANGETYNMNALSAAHPTLPMPTYARVTNLDNGRSLVVRINDRGPFAHDREIDLSQRAAELLDFTKTGTAEVRVQYVGAAPEGENRWQTTTVPRHGDPSEPVMTAAAGPAATPDDRDGASRERAPMPTARPLGTASTPGGGEGNGSAQSAFALAPGFAPAPRTNAVDRVFSLFDQPPGPALRPASAPASPRR